MDFLDTSHAAFAQPPKIASPVNAVAELISEVL